MKKGLIKKNQLWKSKDSGRVLRIIQKWSGNLHWAVEDINRKNCGHHIHEGTLQKFYERVK